MENTDPDLGSGPVLEPAINQGPVLGPIVNSGAVLEPIINQGPVPKAKINPELVPEAKVNPKPAPEAKINQESTPEAKLRHVPDPDPGPITEPVSELKSALRTYSSLGSIFGSNLSSSLALKPEPTYDSIPAEYRSQGHDALAVTGRLLEMLRKRDPREAAAYLAANRCFGGTVVSVLASEIVRKARRVSALVKQGSRARLRAVCDGLLFAALTFTLAMVTEKRAHQSDYRGRTMGHICDIVRALASVNRRFAVELVNFFIAYKVIRIDVLIVLRSILYPLARQFFDYPTAPVPAWDFDMSSPTFSFSDYAPAGTGERRPRLAAVFPFHADDDPASLGGLSGTDPSPPHTPGRDAGFARACPESPTSSLAGLRQKRMARQQQQQQMTSYGMGDSTLENVDAELYEDKYRLTISVRKFIRTWVQYQNSWGQSVRNAGFKRAWTRMLAREKRDGQPACKRGKCEESARDSNNEEENEDEDDDWGLNMLSVIPSYSGGSDCDGSDRSDDVDRSDIDNYDDRYSDSYSDDDDGRRRRRKRSRSRDDRRKRRKEGRSDYRRDRSHGDKDKDRDREDSRDKERSRSRDKDRDGSRNRYHSSHRHHSRTSSHRDHDRHRDRDYDRDNDRDNDHNRRHH